MEAVEGSTRVIRKLQNLEQILNRPLRNFHERADLAIENRAKADAPVDQGRLRASLTHRIDGSVPPRYSEVGSNVFYARAQEYGTGTQSDDPQSSHQRHFPPGPALGLWAVRHGFAGVTTRKLGRLRRQDEAAAQAIQDRAGWFVAKLIAFRGGLKPRRFLRNAFQASLSDIRGFVHQLGAEIAAEWGKKGG